VRNDLRSRCPVAALGLCAARPVGRACGARRCSAGGFAARSAHGLSPPDAAEDPSRALVAGIHAISCGAGPLSGRTGNDKSCRRNSRMTALALCSSLILRNTNSRRLCTCSSGFRTISPLRARANPPGRGTRSSPRAAFCCSPDAGESVVDGSRLPEAHASRQPAQVRRKEMAAQRIC
jgi:hypothetical protein